MLINGKVINGSGATLSGVLFPEATSGGLSVTQESGIYAAGTVTQSNSLYVVQSATFSAQGGGTLDLTASASFSATGVVTIEGQLAVTQAASFTATGRVSPIGALSVQQAASFSAHGGGYLNVTQPAASFSASGKAGSIGELTVIQTGSFSASGSVGIVGNLSVTQPEMLSTWGKLSVTQSASFSSWTAPQEANLFAYAMNIKTGETSVYTNYAFKFVIRIGHEYYGVKSDGLYQLTGNTDNGTAIDARIRTAETDFGSSFQKRMPYVYLDSDTATTIKPTADGAGSTTYDSSFHGRRTHLSRGLTGRFWAVEVANKSGAAMKLGSLELLAEQLSRKV